jgi:hypothetical protein
VAAVAVDPQEGLNKLYLEQKEETKEVMYA